MKRAMFTTLTLLIALAGAEGALAQDDPRLVIPLSDPSRPVMLRVSLISGSIEINGYDGSEVLVIAKLQAMETEGRTRSDGMRRIPNTALGLSAEENDNLVRIGGDHSRRPYDIEIRVPYRTSVHASTINNGDLRVRGVSGEHELSNTNGGIFATDMTGSVLANTTNGDVRVVLKKIPADKPMSFASFNGDVDVTLPADLEATLRIDPGRGEILTDFEAEVLPQEPVIEQGKRGRGYRVEVSREVVARVGGGGPAFRFKTFNGDIFVRKLK